MVREDGVWERRDGRREEREGERTEGENCSMTGTYVSKYRAG